MSFNVSFYLLMFSIPFLAVSPWQEVFSVPVGYIYVALIALNYLVGAACYGVKGLLAKLISAPLFPLMIVFIIINLVSVIINMGQFGLGKDTIVEFGYRVFSVGVYLLVFVFSREENLKTVLGVYLAGAVLAAVFGIYETLGYMLGFETGQKVLYIVPRLYGTGTEPQVFGNFLLSCLPLAAAFLVFSNGRSSIKYFIAFFLLLLAMVMTISVGAWAGLAGSSLLLMMFFRTFSFKGFAIGLLAVFLVMVAVWGINRYLESDYYMALKTAVEVKLIGKEPLTQSVSNVEKQSATVQMNKRSFVERSWFRYAAWSMFKDNPLIGVGVGNYGNLYNDYRPPGTPELDFKVKTHNQYLKILSETGIFGFTVFLAIIFVLIFRFIRSYFVAKRELKMILVGLLISLLGIGIHGYSFGYLRHNYSWVLVSLLVAAIIQVEDRTRRGIGF